MADIAFGEVDATTFDEKPLEKYPIRILSLAWSRSRWSEDEQHQQDGENGSHVGVLNHREHRLGRFAFEGEVCECETRNGESETVESVRKDCSGREIGIFPESIKQWVVEPMVVTAVV